MKLYEEYVPWANSLDSAGKDSGPARGRLLEHSVLGMVHENIRAIIKLGQRSDALKKWVFYGKESDIIEQPIDWITEQELETALRNMDDHNIVRIYHALLGLFTEVGEMFENFEAHCFRNEPFDWENYTEEVGDLFWYMALLAAAKNYTNFVPFLVSNKAKLVKRYGTAWTQDAAINRDHGAEMKALSGAIDSVQQAPLTLDEATDFVKTLIDSGAKVEVKEVRRCPNCGHQPHKAHGCYNIQSDNDCECRTDSTNKYTIDGKKGLFGDIDDQQTRVG